MAVYAPANRSVLRFDPEISRCSDIGQRSRRGTLSSEPDLTVTRPNTGEKRQAIVPALRKEQTRIGRRQSQ